MKGVIIAGGRGKRLEELGKEIPKCLIEVHGETFLERQIRILSKFGINLSDIRIVIGSKGECWTPENIKRIRSIVSDVIVNEDNDKTNNTYGLRLCLDGVNEDVLAVDGDLYFTEETISKMLRYEESSIISTKTLPGSPGNRIKQDDAGLVSEISRITDSDMVYGGILKISKIDLKDLKEEISKEDYFNVDTGLLINNLAKKISIRNVLDDNWVNANRLEELNKIKKISENKNFLVLMGGYTAVGKSTTANKIAEAFGADIYHSFSVRNDLNLSPKSLEDADELFDFKKGKREQMDKMVYTKLAEYAEESLIKGHNVVLDAGYFFKWQRNLVYDAAKKFNLEIILIRVVCKDELEIKKRIENRAKEFGKSLSAETPSWNTYLATKEITEKQEDDVRDNKIKIIEYDTLNKEAKISIGSESELAKKIISVLEHKIFVQDDKFNLREVNDENSFKIFKNKFVVALDFDGVIDNPYVVKTKYINEALRKEGYDIQIDEKNSSRTDCLKAGIPLELYEEASISAYTEKPELLPLEQGVMGGLGKLKKLNGTSFVIITNRYSKMLKHLETYLKYHRIKVDGVINTDNTGKKTPLEFSRARIFVEDSAKNIKEILGEDKNFWQKCKLIFYRNISNILEPLELNVEEAKNWIEIEQKITEEHSKFLARTRT